MKKIYVFRIVSFFIVILAFVFKMNLNHDQVSGIDNRNLIEISDIRSGDITNNIEQFVSDRIGFRTNMINIYTESMDKLFGEMIHPSYQYGKNGYIYSIISKEEDDMEFQEVYSDFILTIQNYCSDHGIDFLYTLEPKKATIYDEYLPSGYIYENRNTEYFISLLEEKDISFLNNIDVLEGYKDEVQVFDMKYDAGHWNETGAMIGMAAILDRLGEVNEGVRPLDYGRYEQVLYKNTTLPVSYFGIDEDTYHYELLDDNTLEVDTYKGTIEISREYSRFEDYLNLDNSESPSILVFAGSYFNDKAKFMTPSFSEYVRIHNYQNVLNYEYYINLFKPDIVLFESTEYTHSNTFFNVEEMKEATLSGKK